MRSIKCVVVGDKSVGKSSAVISFTTNNFPESIPKLCDNISVNLMVDGEPVLLNIFDTLSPGDNDRFRPLSYPQTDVFLLCYSVVNPSSFENIKNLWLHELEFYCPRTPIMLVGTQIDLRENDVKDETSIDAITTEQGISLAEQLKLNKFMEFSALNGNNLKEVFYEAVRQTAILRKRTCRCRKHQLFFRIANSCSLV